MPDWWRLYARPESVADVEVVCEIVRRGYGRHLKSQFPMDFDPERDGVHGTVIDLFWDHPINHAVFLDGPVHDTVHQARIDNLVTQALERRDITVQRIPYDPPRSKREKRIVYNWICDEIEAALNEKVVMIHVHR
jgi:hypothetical protein